MYEIIYFVYVNEIQKFDVHPDNEQFRLSIPLIHDNILGCEHTDVVHDRVLKHFHKKVQVHHDVFDVSQS